MKYIRHCEPARVAGEAIQSVTLRSWHKMDCRVALLLAMTVLVALPLSACGNKGQLKSPSKMEQERAKKEAKQKKPEVKKNTQNPLSPEGEGSSETTPKSAPGNAPLPASPLKGEEP